MNIETGDYYYRARMMDSSVGMFSGKDPLKCGNSYVYVDSRPLHFRDPSGMIPQSIGVILDAMRFLLPSGRLLQMFLFQGLITKGIESAGEWYKNEVRNRETDKKLIKFMLNEAGGFDKFKHCYGGCMLTYLFGGPQAYAGQLAWEVFVSKDKEGAPADNRAALNGITAAFGGRNCKEHCYTYARNLYR
ncbi:hypothetical protein KAI78_11080 [bacterium]|nr:hypothetical protein [bacterium]